MTDDVIIVTNRFKIEVATNDIKVINSYVTENTLTSHYKNKSVIIF